MRYRLLTSCPGQISNTNYAAAPQLRSRAEQLSFCSEGWNHPGGVWSQGRWWLFFRQLVKWGNSLTAQYYAYLLRSKSHWVHWRLLPSMCRIVTLVTQTLDRNFFALTGSQQQINYVCSEQCSSVNIEKKSSFNVPCVQGSCFSWNRVLKIHRQYQGALRSAKVKKQQPMPSLNSTFNCME